MDLVTKVVAGEEATIAVRVLNTSSIVVEVQLRIWPDDVAAWFAQPPTVRLLPMESSLVTLEVTVPVAFNRVGSSVEFTVEVMDQTLGSPPLLAHLEIAERSTVSGWDGVVPAGIGDARS